jgi:hypothetical protein
MNEEIAGGNKRNNPIRRRLVLTRVSPLAFGQKKVIPTEWMQPLK